MDERKTKHTPLDPETGILFRQGDHPRNPEEDVVAAVRKYGTCTNAALATSEDGKRVLSIGVRRIQQIYSAYLARVEMEEERAVVAAVRAYGSAGKAAAAVDQRTGALLLPMGVIRIQQIYDGYLERIGKTGAAPSGADAVSASGNALAKGAFAEKVTP